MQVPQPPELIHLIATLILLPPSQCREPKGTRQGRERRSQGDHVRAIRSRWEDDRLRWRIRHAQSLGCRYPSPPDTSPSPNLSAPTLAAASLELKAENENAHSDCIKSVAFSPDGKSIVSGSDDKTIKVWDAGVGTDTLQPLRPALTASVLVAASLELKVEKQSAHSDLVLSVAFSPDGKTIVSGSRDKTLKVWDAGTPACPIPHLAQT